MRVPDLRSVALPEPFSRIIDHPDFQRLRRVRQLGPIHLLYPGAVHTRFEHSLGVFFAAAAYLRSLSRLDAFADQTDADDLLCVLAAALLHDIGHYPFAHSLEALHSRAFDAPRHEDLAADLLIGRLTSAAAGPSLGDLIEAELGIDRERVARMVQLGASTELPAKEQLLASVINSAIDADKLDYLERDSLHMGVSYGRMPDRDRLTASLTLNGAGDRIALTEKGRVAGEIFSFSRYLMFSEAYWHHAARAASAMIEAALADFVAREAPSRERLVTMLLGSADDVLLERVAGASSSDTPAARLLSGLTLNARGLYKRVLTLSRQRDGTPYAAAYDVVYPMDGLRLADLVARARTRLSRLSAFEIPDGGLLVDTPPRDKDRQESIEIVFDGVRGRESVPIEALSRVVHGIATDFVKVVKKIRIFVAPEVRRRLVGKEARVEAALLEEIFSSPSPTRGGS